MHYVITSKAHILPLHTDQFQCRWDTFLLSLKWLYRKEGENGSTRRQSSHIYMYTYIAQTLVHFCMRRDIRATQAAYKVHRMVFGSETTPYKNNCVLFYCFLTTSIILLKGRVGGATGLNTPVTAVRVTQGLIRHAALRMGEVINTYYQQQQSKY